MLKYSKKEETGEMRKSLCIVAGYDAESQIQKYVLHLLKCFQEELQADVVYVTTSKEVSDEDKAKVADLGVSLIHRENSGYDFQSYFTGFEYFKEQLDQYEKIYHTNDSVFGPFGSLKSIVEKMDNTGYDVWGMTDSMQYKYHLQSYFVCFKKEAFSAMQKFWDQYTFADDYQSVVQNGEIGMSQFLLDEGLCLGAAFPLEKYISAPLSEVESQDTSSRGQYVFRKNKGKLRWYSIALKALTSNASLLFCDRMMQDGYPFLKRRILIDPQAFGYHYGNYARHIKEEYMYALSVAQASVHRDWREIVIPKPNIFVRYIFRAGLYRHFQKSWSSFLEKVMMCR